MHKNDFPLLRNTNVAWLDNASTTQKPQVVLDAMTEHYSHFNANVHRGIYTLGEQATAAYESVRGQVQQFINATSLEEIIFTSGTTASLNLVVNSLGQLLLKPGDVILLSPLEHHSNLVPWQLVAQRTGAKLEFFEMDPATAVIDITTVSNKIHERVKIIAVTHISNAAGTIQPIEKIIMAAHKHNIPVVVDAAQSVPHLEMDVQKLDCDFLAFSGHKLCGPTGTGVLYGKKKWLEQMQPWQGGGDMIREVMLEKSTWNDLPYKFEAGTPNIAGVIGLGAALTYLNTIGMNTITTAVTKIYRYLLDELTQLDFIQVLGTSDITQRSSIASIVMNHVHPHDVAQVLDKYNVAIRAGHHCCQPLMNIWKVPATARASVYFYNTTEDIDRLVVGLKDVYQKFR